MLDLADIIEPGMTKWRGELLFETQATAVILTQRALDEGKVKNFQAQVRIKTIHKCALTIFDEYKTQSATVLTVLRKRAHQNDSNYSNYITCVTYCE